VVAILTRQVALANARVSSLSFEKKMTENKGLIQEIRLPIFDFYEKKYNTTNKGNIRELKFYNFFLYNFVSKFFIYIFLIGNIKSYG
jgi:hypothetical protein